MSRRLPFRKGVILARDVRPGDVLWSEERGRLLVMMVEHVPTPEIAFGKETGRVIDTVRLAVLEQKIGAKPFQIGNYRLESELQLVKRARSRRESGGS